MGLYRVEGYCCHLCTELLRIVVRLFVVMLYLFCCLIRSYDGIMSLLIVVVDVRIVVSFDQSC